MLGKGIPDMKAQCGKDPGMFKEELSLVGEGRRVIVGDRRGEKGCRGPGEGFDLHEQAF